MKGTSQVQYLPQCRSCCQLLPTLHTGDFLNTQNVPKQQTANFTSVNHILVTEKFEHALSSILGNQKKINLIATTYQFS